MDKRWYCTNNKELNASQNNKTNEIIKYHHNRNGLKWYKFLSKDEFHHDFDRILSYWNKTSIVTWYIQNFIIFLLHLWWNQTKFHQLIVIYISWDRYSRNFVNIRLNAFFDKILSTEFCIQWNSTIDRSLYPSGLRNHAKIKLNIKNVFKFWIDSLEL